MPPEPPSPPALTPSAFLEALAASIAALDGSGVEPVGLRGIPVKTGGTARVYGGFVYAAIRDCYTSLRWQGAAKPGRPRSHGPLDRSPVRAGEGRSMTEHVYFLLDELKNRIRIGQTDNLLRRMLDHQKENGFRLKLLGVTEGGYEREQAIQAMFPALRLPRESSRGKPVQGASDDWFRAEPELHRWIAANTNPWDGADTFNWQSNIPSPTLAMYGTEEWIGWVEELARHLGVELGTLVERAMAGLAEQRGFRGSPPRVTDPKTFPAVTAAPSPANTPTTPGADAP
jgi:hypothetical protein